MFYHRNLVFILIRSAVSESRGRRAIVLCMNTAAESTLLLFSVVVWTTALAKHPAHHVYEYVFAVGPKKVVHI